MGRLRVIPLDGKSCQKPAHVGGGGGATARRVARGARIRRRHGYGVRSVARRAWVQALGCTRPWASARQTSREKHHGSMAGFQEIQMLRTTRRRRPTCRAFPRRGRGRGALGCDRPGHTRSTTNRKKITARRSVLQNPGLGASPPRGTAARRGFSLSSANGSVARRQHQERPTARLGVAMERGLLRTSQRNVETSLILRTATTALKSTSGPGAPSVAARQFCGSMASIQARNNGDASRRRESIAGRRPRGRRD
jgi:hypothetical protein